ncbi:hypothetical protein G9A89_004395 [Geosiphon pyriformis]|nr:hypothetical protein G9A89_004395 [Geosiphon pyriformis]
MEQKLIELTSASKKALELGENLCSKANLLEKECKVDVERIERVYPKLRFFWGELQVQVKAIKYPNVNCLKILKTVERLGEFAAKQNGFKIGIIAGDAACRNTKEKELLTILEELESTLDILRSKPVDPAIRKNAINLASDNVLAIDNQSGEVSLRGLIDPDIGEKDKIEKATLYDYVDEQSVQELKIRTQEEVSAMQQILSDSTNLVSHIDVQLEHFRARLNEHSISLEESGIEFSDEKCKIQEREINSMAETLMSLARHYDQVSGAFKALQSHSEFDISVLIRDTDEIPTIVEELNEALMIIGSTSEEVRIRSHLYNASYAEASKFFIELDQFGDRMEDIAGTMKAIDGDFEKGRSVVERLFEELWNLIGWYEEFSKSYDYLIIEIDRRHEVREHHERLAEEYLAKLEGLYIEEAQQRSVFFEKHGRYLPIDLCPPILEGPIRYDIVAQDVTRLPVVSVTTLKEAQTNLLRYGENVP